MPSEERRTMRYIPPCRRALDTRAGSLLPAAQPAIRLNAAFFFAVPIYRVGGKIGNRNGGLGLYASAKRSIRHGTAIFESLKPDGRAGDEETQGGDIAKRRQREEGDQPPAGHRNRPVRGPARGEKGSEKSGRTENRKIRIEKSCFVGEAFERKSLEKDGPEKSRVKTALTADTVASKNDL